MSDTSWIPTSALARELGVHRRTIARWATEGGFPDPRVFNRRLYFSRDEIEAWKESKGGDDHRAQTIKGDVYFIGYGEYVKIGVARNVSARLKTLQIYCPETLTIRRVIKNGGHEQEKKLHLRFSNYRRGGEWFMWTDEMGTAM